MTIFLQLKVNDIKVNFIGNETSDRNLEKVLKNTVDNLLIFHKDISSISTAATSWLLYGQEKRRVLFHSHLT